MKKLTLFILMTTPLTLLLQNCGDTEKESTRAETTASAEPTEAIDEIELALRSNENAVTARVRLFSTIVESNKNFFGRRSLYVRNGGTSNTIDGLRALKKINIDRDAKTQYKGDTLGYLDLSFSAQVGRMLVIGGDVSGQTISNPAEIIINSNVPYDRSVATAILKLDFSKDGEVDLVEGCLGYLNLISDYYKRTSRSDFNGNGLTEYNDFKALYRVFPGVRADYFACRKSPLHNRNNKFDVNGSGSVSSLDELNLSNFLAKNLQGKPRISLADHNIVKNIHAQKGANFFPDVDGDRDVDSFDLLQLANEIRKNR